MEKYHSDCNNNNDPDRKKTAIESKIYRRFITTIALPTVLLILTFIAAAPISPVQATGGGGGNETAATPAPGGASLGPAANETNVTTTTAVTQSACLPQNATTTGRPAVVLMIPQPQTIQQQLLHLAVLAYASNKPDSIFKQELRDRRSIHSITG